jgi:OCT family organic cation transporter-like MFS transporter 4/5
MLKSSYRITTFTLVLSWIFINVGTYTLTFSATSLAGDIFVNFLLMNLADSPVPFIFYLTLDRFGRKWCMCISEVALGLSCLALAFIPKDYKTAILVVYLLGKLTSSMAFSMIWLVTLELYPTNLRTQESYSAMVR